MISLYFCSDFLCEEDTTVSIVAQEGEDCDSHDLLQFKILSDRRLHPLIIEPHPRDDVHFDVVGEVDPVYVSVEIIGGDIQLVLINYPLHQGQ